jgi:anti-sigma factor RsiW
VKLSDDLILEARAVGAVARRSIAGQVAFWARLGKSIELLGRRFPGSLPVPIRQPNSLPLIAGSVVLGNLRGVPEFVELGSDKRVELP